MKFYIDIALNFIQNHPVIFIFGAGSVITGIVGFIKVFLVNKRKTDKMLMPERKERLERLRITLKSFRNKITGTIHNELSESLPPSGLIAIATSIQTLFTQDVQKFSENKDVLSKKAIDKILLEHNTYTKYYFEHLSTVVQIGNISKIVVLQQFNYYLSFNALLKKELDEVESDLAKKLGYK